jgi:hypothetical protein
VSHSIMSNIMSAPASPNRAAKKKAQPPQGVNARVLNSSANQSLMLDAEKIKILQKSQKFRPKEHGTDI